MRWMNDVKVAYKILILSVIAVIAMSLIGYTGYAGLEESGRQMDVMYKQKLQAVYYIGEEKFILRDMQSRAALAMAADPADAKRFQELKDDLQKSHGNFLANGQEYAKLVADDPDAGQKIAAVGKDEQEFEQVVDQVISLSAAGQRAEAAALYNGTGVKITMAVRKQLEDLQDRARTNAETIYQTNAENQKAASRSMLIKIVLAFLLLIVVSLWIARELVAPVRKMIGFCARLREGDFRDLPRDIERRDEFGEMADELVNMRSVLNKLMKATHDSSEQLAAASEELTASAGQSAQASTQVAESVTSAAGAVASQQESVNSSSLAVQKSSKAIADLDGEARKVAAHSAAAFERAVAGSEAIHKSVEQIKSVETTVSSSSDIVNKLGKRS